MSHTSFEPACEQVRRHLDAYVDHELAAAASQEVRLHLESCAGCAVEAGERASLKARVRSVVRAQTAPPELAVKVRDRLQAGMSRPWWALPSISAQKWALTAVALAIACVGIWVAMPGEPLPALGDRPAQNAYIRRISANLAGVLRPGLADHIHCAIFRKYPADPPPAAAMLADLGPYRDLLPAVIAAIPKSWRVVMAHQCSYLGRKYVHVTMRDGDRLVSLVIARKEGGESFAGMKPAVLVEGIPLYRGRTGKFQIAGFEAAGYLAFVVSDLDAAENLAAASRLPLDLSRILAINL